MGTSARNTLVGSDFNNFNMNPKIFGAILFAVAAQAAPSPDADPSYLAAAAYHVPAANCKVENEILITKSWVPTAENVSTKETVDTEEIEYEKGCKDVVDTICDAPVAAPLVATHVVKREAEADPLYYAAAPYAAGYAVAPAAHAVAHSAVTTVKHACREVTTQHCVNNPEVKIVPVEVEHCHTVTKVACTDVENAIPKTTCEPVETTHVAGYALPYASYIH